MLNDKPLIFTAIGLAIVLVLGTVMVRCDHKKVQEITNVTLQPKEKEAIIVDTEQRTVTTVNQPVKSSGRLVPLPVVTVEKGVRDVRISVGDNGKVNVSYRTKGFCFEPGVALGEADTARLGLDAQLGFYKQWGALAGVSAHFDSVHSKLSLYAGVSYLLPWKVTSNTSVFVSYDTRKQIFFGVRVKL